MRECHTTFEGWKNLSGILASLSVEAPPKPRSISSSAGSTSRENRTLSTLDREEEVTSGIMNS